MSSFALHREKAQEMKKMTPKYETFNSIKTLNEPVIYTGDDKLDSWWSSKGGIVVGSAIFMTGTSGAGKTTFSVFLAKLLNQHKTSLYSREMHRSQVKEQTERLNMNHDNLFISDTETCPTFEDYMKVLDELKPKFVFIDSLQVITLEDQPEENQEKAQYDVIKALRDWTRENNAILFVIGHNKKDGEFRGANTIMQMFDAHIEMIHHKKENFRTIAWGQKNRKGPLKEMYYEFAKDSIMFYSKEEWDEKNGGVKVLTTELKNADDLEKVLESLLNNFVKMHLQYKEHPNWDKYIDACKVVPCDSKVEQYSRTLSVLESNFRKYIKK